MEILLFPPVAFAVSLLFVMGLAALLSPLAAKPARVPGSAKHHQRNREQSHQPLQTLLETQPAEETTSAANYGTVLDEILRAKPASAKGRYLKSITVTSTMGPGIKVDSNRTRDLLEETSA